MIEFLGTRLLLNLPDDQREASLADICGVSIERAGQIVDALMKAKKEAFITEEKTLTPGMPPVPAKLFSVTKLLSDANVDTDTPSEILLVGILIGRICTEMEERAKQSSKRLTKMLALMAKDPTKALRKMQKDIAKASKKAK